MEEEAREGERERDRERQKQSTSHSLGSGSTLMQTPHQAPLCGGYLLVRYDCICEANHPGGVENVYLIYTYE